MLKGVLLLIPTNRLHLFTLPVVASMPDATCRVDRCLRHLPSTFGDLGPAHRHQLPASPAGGPAHFLHFRNRDWGRHPNESEIDLTHGASGQLKRTFLILQASPSAWEEAQTIPDITYAIADRSQTWLPGPGWAAG